MKTYTLLALILMLAGCGGGGGGDDSPESTSYTVQTSAGSGGSISPSSQSVNSGQSATFTVTPDASHNIQSVTGCGGSLSGQSYTTGPITANCTVQASFTLKSFTVTAAVSAGEGEISPASRTVNYGETTSFTLTAAAGYQIESVSGCSGSLSGAVYSTAEITSNCAVQARFNPLTVSGANATTGEQLSAEVTGDNNWAFGADTLGYVADDGEPGSALSELQGYHALYPLFDFELVKGEQGSNAGVVLSFEAPIPQGAAVLKYGPQTAGADPQWYQLDPGLYVVAEDRRSLTLTVTDGETGDDDLTANGYIKDPVAIGLEIPSDGVTYFPVSIYTTAETLTPVYRSLWAEQNTSAVIELEVPTGYQISAVTADGCSGALEGQIFTTEAITAECHLSVSLEVASFIISAVQSANGTINPEQIELNYGETAEFTLTPSEGYQISSATGCDGSLQGNLYTTGPAVQNCEVSAVFAVISYEVTAVAETGGSITPASQLVEAGGTAQFTVAANAGYAINQVSGCGGTLEGAVYTTAVITQSCTVTATFSLLSFEVTATASSGGSISPASQSVSFGATAEFTLTPDSGYITDLVTGCAGSLSGNTYTTGAITAPCAVSASFIKDDSVIVTVQSDEGGTVAPQRFVGLPGDSVTFELTPDPDYFVASATGCGGTLTGNSYHIASLTQSCTVNVDFAPEQVVVTVQSTEGATVSPLSSTVAYGEQVLISIVPDAGYNLDSVTGCGGTLNDSNPAEYTYTTAALTANCQVEVVMAVQTFLVATEILSGEGEISPSSQLVSYGQQAEFTLTAANGFSIGTVQGCDGTMQNGLYVTAEIYSACTVSVTFTAQSTDLVPDALLAASIRQALGLAADHQLTADDLAQLSSLDASNQEITDLTGLEYATALSDLRLNSTLVSDLTPLSALPLTELQLNFTQVSDVSALAAMPLQNLYLSGALVSDISPLSEMPIRFVDLSATDVSDISVISGWQNLYGLQLSDTKVLDLTPAVTSGLPNQATKWVQVYGCLSLYGYSRSQLAIDSLTAAGVDVDAYDKSIFNKGSCPDTVATTTANLTASFSSMAGPLELDWQVSNPWDNGAWRCSVYFNLDQQQARLANETIDNCGLDSSVTLDYPGSAVKPTMLFEDGLGGKVRADLERLVASDRPATASYDSYDWGQVVLKTNPKLVSQREALLRVHVTATDNAVLPEVDIVLTPISGGPMTINATAPTELPADKTHASLTASYTALVPANYMEAGLSVDILVDNTVVEQISPQFADVSSLSMYLVPVEVEGVAPVLPELATLNQNLKSFWPFETVELRVAEPLVVDEASPVDLSTVLDDLTFMAENQSSEVYFYGYVASAKVVDGQGGLAYLPGKTGVGIDNDSNAGIHAHELGHNLGRPHVDCGEPDGPDTSYPYDPATTGSVGINLTSDSLLLPEDYTDLMSYCWPQHISDYNYEKVQDYIQSNPPPAFDVAERSANQNSLYIDGHINAKGELSIRHLMPVSHYRKANTEQRLQVELQNGAGKKLQAQLNLPQLGHGKAKQQFFYGYLPAEQLTQLRVANAQQSWNFELSAAEQQLQQQLAFTNPVVSIVTRGSQVCLNWPAQQFDSATLMHQGDLNTVVLNNSTLSGQCRSLHSLPQTGEWVISLRKGLTVKQVRQQVNH